MFVEPAKAKATVGEEIPVKVSVYPKVGYEVKVSFNGESFSDTPPFTKTFYFKADKPGKHLLKVYAEGNGIKKEKSVEINVYVPTEVEITEISSREILRGEKLEVSGYLKSKLGYLDGMPVKIYLKERKDGSGVLVGETTTRNGHFTAIVDTNVKAGRYHVVAEFDGYGYYLPSKSDPKVIIKDHTNVEIVTQSAVLKGERVKVKCILTDSEGRVDGRLKVCFGNRCTNVMTKNGIAEVEFKAEYPGVVKVKAEFDGNEYLMPCSNETLVKVSELSVDIFTPGEAVNGEKIKISGRISPPILREITVVLPNRTITAKVENGEFAVDYDVALKPGEHTVKYIFGNVSVERKLKVKSKTRIDFDNGSFTLLDDFFDEPLPNMTLFVNGVAYVTDENGKVEFEGGYFAKAEFKGSDYYLPSSKTVNLFPYHLLALAPVSVAVAYMATKVRPKIGRCVKEEPKDVSVEYPKSKLVEDSWIEFPMIKEPFPDVWGVGDEFEIIAENSDIYINDKFVGRDSVVLTFTEKGMYTIKAVKDGKWVERKLLIVKYDEEIVKLFKSIAKRFDKNMTAEEIGVIINEPEMVRIFEEANYSLHRIDRDKFERFYLAYLRVGDRE